MAFLTASTTNAGTANRCQNPPLSPTRTWKRSRPASPGHARAVVVGRGLLPAQVQATPQPGVGVLPAGAAPPGDPHPTGTYDEWQRDAPGEDEYDFKHVMLLPWYRIKGSTL